MLCAATHGVLPAAKISQTPLPAGAPPLLPLTAPESAALDPNSCPRSWSSCRRIPNSCPRSRSSCSHHWSSVLAPLELVLTPPELGVPPPELAPPELVLTPPELVVPPPELAPPELVLTPLELVLVTPELVFVLPELELLPPVLAPLDPPLAPPAPAPELPFEALPFDPPGEVSSAPPEQAPVMTTVIIPTAANVDAGRTIETGERETRVLSFAKFMGGLYYVHARGHASTDDDTKPCSRTVNVHESASASRTGPAR